MTMSIGGCLKVFLLLALQNIIAEAVDKLRGDVLPTVSKEMQELVHAKFQEQLNKPIPLLDHLDIPNSKTFLKSVSLNYDGRQPRFDPSNYGETEMEYSTGGRGDDPTAVKTLLRAIKMYGIDSNSWDNAFLRLFDQTEERAAAFIDSIGAAIEQKILEWLNAAKLCGPAKSTRKRQQ